MTYIIYENGEEINRIVADESFVISYCEENGYTYELEAAPEPETPSEDNTQTDEDVWTAIAAAIKEGVNEV